MCVFVARCDGLQGVLGGALKLNHSKTRWLCLLPLIIKVVIAVVCVSA
jgi:hypothetical protein